MFDLVLAQAPSVVGSIRRVVFLVLAALVGGAAGLGTLIGAATITDRPTLFLLAGFAAFCAIYYLGILLATRKVGASRKRRVGMLLFCAGTAAVAGAFALTALEYGFTDLDGSRPDA